MATIKTSVVLAGFIQDTFLNNGYTFSMTIPGSTYTTNATTLQASSLLTASIIVSNNPVIQPYLYTVS